MEQWLGFVLYIWMWRKIHKPKPWINQAYKEIHTATLGMKLTSVLCKLEIKKKTYQSQKWNFTPTPNPYPHQMCNHALIQNQYPPPNVESRPYSKSICKTCQDLNQGPSACNLSVKTTTPPVLDTILIQQQAIILPR